MKEKLEDFLANDVLIVETAQYQKSDFFQFSLLIFYPQLLAGRETGYLALGEMLGQHSVKVIPITEAPGKK